MLRLSHLPAAREHHTTVNDLLRSMSLDASRPPIVALEAIVFAVRPVAQRWYAECAAHSFSPHQSKQCCVLVQRHSCDAMCQRAMPPPTRVLCESGTTTEAPRYSDKLDDDLWALWRYQIHRERGQASARAVPRAAPLRPAEPLESRCTLAMQDAPSDPRGYALLVIASDRQSSCSSNQQNRRAGRERDSRRASTRHWTASSSCSTNDRLPHSLVLCREQRARPKPLSAGTGGRPGSVPLSTAFDAISLPSLDADLARVQPLSSDVHRSPDPARIRRAGAFSGRCVGASTSRESPEPATRVIARVRAASSRHPDRNLTHSLVNAQALFRHQQQQPST